MRGGLSANSVVAAMPSAVLAAVTGGVVLLCVGLAALLGGTLGGLTSGLPWLFPALGPTAYLQAENPGQPVSRFYNTVVGHSIGLAAGFLAVALLGAWSAPAALPTHQLPPPRAWASVIALVLTLTLALSLRASHPPAAATTLLVTLGTFSTALDAMNVMIGVLIVALAGELMRRIRRRPGARDLVARVDDPRRLPGSQPPGS